MCFTIIFCTFLFLFAEVSKDTAPVSGRFYSSSPTIPEAITGKVILLQIESHSLQYNLHKVG